MGDLLSLYPILNGFIYTLSSPYNLFRIPLSLSFLYMSLKCYTKSVKLYSYIIISKLLTSTCKLECFVVRSQVPRAHKKNVQKNLPVYLYALMYLLELGE